MGNFDPNLYECTSTLLILVDCIWRGAWHRWVICPQTYTRLLELLLFRVCLDPNGWKAQTRLRTISLDGT